MKLSFEEHWARPAARGGAGNMDSGQADRAKARKDPAAEPFREPGQSAYEPDLATAGGLRAYLGMADDQQGGEPDAAAPGDRALLEADQVTAGEADLTQAAPDTDADLQDAGLHEADQPPDDLPESDAAAGLDNLFSQSLDDVQSADWPFSPALLAREHESAAPLQDLALSPKQGAAAPGLNKRQEAAPGELTEQAAASQASGLGLQQPAGPEALPAPDPQREFRELAAELSAEAEAAGLDPRQALAALDYGASLDAAMSLTAQTRGNPQIQANAALATAAPLPEGTSAAELRALASRLNIPIAMLATQPELVKKRLAASLLAQNPGLAAFAAQNPQNAAIAIAGARPGLLAREAFLPLARTAWRGPEATAVALASYPHDIPWLTDPFKNFANGWLDLARNVLGAAKSGADLALGRESAIARWFGGFVDGLRDLEFSTTRPRGFAGRLAQDLVRSAPQLASQIVAWLAGGPLPATGYMFGQIYGGDYLRLTEKGVTPENAAFAALLDGAVQTAMERVGLHAVLSSFGKSGALGLASFLEGRGALGAAAKAAPVEGLTEAAQHMPEYLTDWWAESSKRFDSFADRAAWTWRQATDARHLLEGTADALYQGLVGGILGGVAAGGLHRYQQWRLSPELEALMAAERAQASAITRRNALSQSMAQAWEALKSAPSDPDARRQILENSLPPENRAAWLDAADLQEFIRLHPAQEKAVAFILNMDAQALAGRIAEGAPLEADIARLLASPFEAANTGGVSLARELSELLRLEPQGPTAAIASAWDPQERMNSVLRVLNHADELEDYSADERLNAAAQEARESRETLQGMSRELTRLKNEMRDAGLSDLEVQSHARLIEAHAMAWWQRYRVSPENMLATWKIHRGLDSAANPSEQNLKTPALATLLKGRVAIATGSRDISLLPGRDVSTLAHELGHIFLDDLMQMYNVDARSLVADFEQQLDLETGNDFDFFNEIAENVLKNRAMPGEHSLLVMGRRLDGAARREKARAADLSRQLHEARLNQSQDQGLLEQQIGQARLRSQSARRLARLARRHAQTMRGLATARTDLVTIASHVRYSLADLKKVINYATSADTDEWLTERRYYAEFQEEATRLFIRYLARGQAPVKSLEAPLARFSGWFASYEGAIAKEEALDPELVTVMDRLLVSESAIMREADNWRASEEDFLDSPQMAEFGELRGLLDKIRLDAAQEIGADLRRELARYRRARVPQLEEELDQELFWQAVKKARFNQADLENILGEQAAAQLVSVHPRILARKPRARAALMASSLGYDSAGALLAEMHERLYRNHETKRRSAEIVAAAEARGMLEQRQEAEKLGGCPQMAAYLASADQALATVAARMRLKSEQEIERWVKYSQTPQKVIEARALRRIRHMPLREVTRGRFRAILSKCLDSRKKALARGGSDDLLMAMNNLNAARVTNAMAALVPKARASLDELRALAAQIKKARPDAFPTEQAEALRVVMSRFRLGEPRQPRNDAVARNGLRLLVERIAAAEDATGSMAAFPDWLLDGLHPGTGRVDEHVDPLELSWSQLEDVKNLMAFLEHSGRNRRGQEKASEQARVDAAVTSCVTSMERLPDWNAGRPRGMAASARSLLSRALSSQDQILHQARKGDGMINIAGESAPGPLEAIARQFMEADERARGWNDTLTKALAPHLAQLRKMRDRLEKAYGRELKINDANGNPLRPPRVWREVYRSDHYNVEMLISMACQLGNFSNIRRLISGYADGPDGFGIDYRAIATLFGSRVAAHVFSGQGLEQPAENGGLPFSAGLLTGADWQAIQGIWDSLALLWPNVRDTHRKMYGFEPRPLELAPFAAIGSDGSLVSLSGGYFPVKYDPLLSERVARWREGEDLTAINDSQLFPPAASHSMTEHRTREAAGLPVALDLSAIGGHILEASRFIEYGPLVRHFDRIIMTPAFQACYRAKFGLDDFEMIRPNLRGLVKSEKVRDVVALLERKLRRFVTPWALAWNPNVAIMQLSAVFPAMGDIGARAVLASMAKLAAHPGLCRDIWRASPYMKSRMRNLDQDLARQTAAFSLERKASLTVKGREYTWDDVVDCGMKMITAADAVATCCVWFAAYSQKLAELNASPRAAKATSQAAAAQTSPGADEQPAANLADSAANAASQAETDKPGDAASQPANSSSENASPQAGSSGKASPASQQTQGRSQAAAMPAQTGASGLVLTGQPASEGGLDNAAGLASNGGLILKNASPWLNADIPGWQPQGSVIHGQQKGGEQAASHEAGHEDMGSSQDVTDQPMAATHDALARPGALASGSPTASQDAAEAPNTSEDLPDARDAGKDGSPNPAQAAREENGHPANAAPEGMGDASQGQAPDIDFNSRHHQEAIRFADLIVKQSNPDYDPSSRSSFLRETGMMRLFNSFASAISLFSARNHYMFTAMRKGQITKARYARHLGFDFFLPACALFLLFGALRDFWDRKNEPLKNFGGLFMDQASMMLPIVGSLASDWSQELLGMGGGNFRRGELRISLDSPTQIATAASRAGGLLWKKNPGSEEKRAAIYAALDVVSFLSRVPVSRVLKKAERGYAQYKRGEGSPLSVIMPRPGK